MRRRKPLAQQEEVKEKEVIKQNYGPPVGATIKERREWMVQDLLRIGRELEEKQMRGGVT